MKRILCIIGLVFFTTMSLFAVTIHYESMTSHPRLLLKAGEEKSVLTSVERNEQWKSLQTMLFDEADKMLSLPPLQYQLKGFRLLSVANEALRRVFYLSYTYRMKGDKRYAERALKEMEAVCRFENWNPRHFLDTGEMLMAMGIGYDWLQDVITPAQRSLVVKAIVEKGLMPSKDPRYEGFTRRTNNWNQVCNSGVALAALAIYEEHPELCKSLIDRSVNTIGRSMAVYVPDGVYPEGYHYWGYGTNFNIMLIASLESALNTDAGLMKAEGFASTSNFINYSIGTSQKAFNYGDSHERLTSFPSLYWFAGRLKDNSILWNEKVFMKKEGAEKTIRRERLLPLALISTRELEDGTITHPKEKCWLGRGETPMMVVRTEWEGSKGCYVAMKGSKAWMSHGHMDAGSFVFDALGVRWACDLGSQSYYKVEDAGLGLWDYRQNGDRWKIFRYNNAVHNTLNIKGEYHLVKGFVDIVKTFTQGKELGGVMNMQPLYGERIKKALRKVVIVDERELLVDDEITTADQPVTFEWVLCTRAQAKQLNRSTWELTQEGKRLNVVVESPASFKISLKDNVPSHSYDEPNKDSRRVVVEITVPANTTQHLKVRLVPQE